VRPGVLAWKRFHGKGVCESVATIAEVAREARVGVATVSRVLNGSPAVRDETRSALFAASDTQALGVLEAAAGLGARVPGDLSVIGYDDWVRS
jgi:DNA-binding LacI/PurR family transcriptional regulator